MDQIGFLEPRASVLSRRREIVADLVDLLSLGRSNEKAGILRSRPSGRRTLVPGEGNLVGHGDLSPHAEPIEGGVHGDGGDSPHDHGRMEDHL